MAEGFPADILGEIIVHLPIQSLVFCSRTCKQMHALVIHAPNYITYKSILPHERACILEYAIVQHQKQYLLQYFLPRCVPSYRLICPFIAEHCSVEECKNLLYRYPFIEHALQYGLARQGRKSALLSLYGSVSLSAVEGFIHGQQYELLSEYSDKYTRYNMCFFSTHYPLQSVEWLSQFYAGGSLLPLCSGCISVGIFPTVSKIISGLDMTMYLGEAATAWKNDLFIELLEACAKHRLWFSNIMLVADSCIRAQNRQCLTALEEFFTKRFTDYRNRFLYVLISSHAQLSGDINAVEQHIARLCMDIDDAYDAAAYGAATEGRTDCVHYFVQKKKNATDLSLLAGRCLLRASVRGHFDTMCSIQKQYCSLLDKEVYFTAFSSYKHDHEWVVDWWIDCVGEEDVKSHLSPWPSTFFLLMPCRMYTLGRLLEKGYLNFCKVYERLTHIHELPFAQLFAASFGPLYEESKE